MIVVFVVITGALIYLEATAIWCGISGFKRGCWVCKILRTGKHRD